MINTSLDKTQQYLPVFKTGDRVQLTRSHGRDLPIGSLATVNERLADDKSVSGDAYIVTFKSDWDIIEVQGLAPANLPHASLISSANLNATSANSTKEMTAAFAEKRPVEQEQNLLGSAMLKKQKHEPKKKRSQPRSIDETDVSALTESALLLSRKTPVKSK